MKLPFERPTIKKLNPGMPSKHGMSPSFSSLPSIDGVDIEELLASYGSPLFIYSEQTIRTTVNQMKRAFNQHYPKVQLAWSYKTNYNEAICRIFHQEGSWAEVVSGFEYQKAFNMGVKGENIIFNGPDKSEADLELASRNGSLIHIDNFDELFTLSEICEQKNIEARVAIRVNMDVGIYPKWDRFGFNYENGEAWEALNRIMVNPKFKLLGLHTHIGTYMMTAQAYRLAVVKLADLAVGVEKKFGYAIKYIDMGGGFASKNTLRGAYLSGEDTTPSFDDFAEAITSAILSSQIKPANLPMLILETGRALIDDAGYVAGTVLANKRLSDGNRATIIDVGVNILFTAFWYDHKIQPTRNVTGTTEETTIFGPLCMNIDVLRYSMLFPPLKRGDKFVISRVGAYNNTQWMQFITMRPNVVLIDTNGKVHSIRKAETIENITANEVVPEHLNKFTL